MNILYVSDLSGMGGGEVSLLYVEFLVHWLMNVIENQ